ncbi:MAG: AAA family ATPase, partial [Thermoanaerobaculia bacterium]|nr:AAA family ATPase [Thermoanaerobaculia bacterium]
MPGVVFRRLDLRFGCHDRSFEFPEGSSPVVVAGPNGSGKSTLIEALARTLFGFNLRLEEDRELRDGRRPWGREGCHGRLLFRAADGRDWELERDFTSHETCLRRVDGDRDEDAFEGDANPAGENPEAEEFRRMLRRLFGLPRLAQYLSTTCIGQGALGETSLSRDLLKAASGGRVDVDEARRRIEEAHRELTSGPIREGEPRGRKDRRLERLESEIRELSRRLGEAERAHESRRPLLRERDDLQARSRVLDAELAELDAAVGPLSRRRTLTLEVEASRRRIHRLEEAEHRLGRAAEGVREAERDLEAALEPGEYPGDFPERLARLEELWTRRRELEEELAALETRKTGIVVPPVWSLLVSGGVAALGGILWALGEPLLAGITGGLGLATAGVLGVVRYARTRARTALRTEIEGIRSRLRAVRERIADRRDRIPAGPEVSNTTADRHRARFRRQEEARARLEAA